MARSQKHRATVVDLHGFKAARAQRQLRLFEGGAAPAGARQDSLELAPRLSLRQVEHRQRMLRFMKAASAG